MKTIQIKSILLTFGLLLSIFDITGQRVITNHPSANGYPVIDLTELSPLKCVLTTQEAETRRILMNEQTPANTECLEVGTTVSAPNGTWNAKMSSQFQVMRSNHTVTTDWANAYNLCKQYNNEGGIAGEWRLPTQRELMIIWGLHPQLLGKGGFNAINNSTVNSTYWSSTEDTNSYAWYLFFYSGAVGTLEKSKSYLVRCIRDLK